MTYTKYFERKQRPNGDNFTCCKEGVPIEIKDLIKDIHFNLFSGALPNDWIYETIVQAFEDLENDSLDGINIESDVYNYQLNEWLNNPFAHEYCNQALQESSSKDIYQVIGFAQWLAKYQIYTVVNDFIALHNKVA